MARTVQVAADAVIMLRFGRLSPTQVAEQSAQIIIGYLAPVLDGPPDTQVNT